MTRRIPIGTVSSGWEQNGKRVSYSLTVPANTTAILRIPAEEKPEGGVEGLHFAGMQKDASGSVAVYEAVAGRYVLIAE